MDKQTLPAHIIAAEEIVIVRLTVALGLQEIVIGMMPRPVILRQNAETIFVLAQSVKHLVLQIAIVSAVIIATKLCMNALPILQLVRFAIKTAIAPVVIAVLFLTGALNVVPAIHLVVWQILALVVNLLLAIFVALQLEHAMSQKHAPVEVARRTAKFQQDKEPAPHAQDAMGQTIHVNQ